MPWVCFTSVVYSDGSTALYNAQICGGQEMLMWAPAGIPPGNCAAPIHPSCVHYPDSARTTDFLAKQTVLRHPDLTEEQNKKIDHISDLIAYQRMNEPDPDK